jgi:integrase
MAKKLTDVAIRNLKAGAVRREVPDGGAVGLYIIVQPSGRKSYAVRYRVGGRNRKLTLPGGLTLAAARKAASDALLEVANGGDPAAVKQQRKRVAKEGSFASVAEIYMALEGNKQRSATWKAGILRRSILPALGELPIGDIRRSDVVRMLDGIERRSGPVAADRALAVASKIFNWHATRSDDFRSPLVRGMRRTNGHERARSRILTDDEIRRIWKTANSDPGPFPALILFLLLTAARRSEAARMAWDEVAGADWTLPAARNKTKQDLLRPLSAAAQALLDARPRIGPFVFTLNGVHPFADFSRAKRVFESKCGVTGWQLHDLRRTARSLMSRAGVPSDHAERCLGHVIGGIRATYDRHEFQTEKARAFEALAAQVDLIVNPPQGNIAEFRRR